MIRVNCLSIVLVTSLVTGCTSAPFLQTRQLTVEEKSHGVQFNAIDTDHNGQITFDETTAWLTALHRENDLNKDGGLDASEIPAILLNTGEKGSEFIGRYDRDGDDKLSLEELHTHANLMFQQDTNADRILTQKEVGTPTRDSSGPTWKGPNNSEEAGIPE